MTSGSSALIDSGAARAGATSQIEKKRRSVNLGLGTKKRSIFKTSWRRLVVTRALSIPFGITSWLARGALLGCFPSVNRGKPTAP